MKRLIIVSGIISIFFFISTICTAANIVIGDKLPELEITKKGECVLKSDGDGTEYVPWNSSCLAGKVQIVEYSAARKSSPKVSEDFYNAVKSENFGDQVTITQLANANDVLWGTSKLVSPGIKSHKKKNPHIRYVLDSEGIGRSLWGLQEKSVSICILDPQGIVLYLKESSIDEKIGEEDIKAAIDIIKKQLNGASASSSSSESASNK